MARILLVDDNAANLQLMNYLLKSFAHEVRATSSATEGLRALQQSAFDVVLCDVLMPEIDGFEFARRMKRDERFSTTPLIAVTALAMVGDRERLLDSGFDGYIAKPIEPERFVCDVESYLGSALDDSHGSRSRR